MDLEGNGSCSMELVGMSTLDGVSGNGPYSMELLGMPSSMELVGMVHEPSR
jgi:hypothetical protein